MSNDIPDGRWPGAKALGAACVLPLIAVALGHPPTPKSAFSESNSSSVAERREAMASSCLRERWRAACDAVAAFAPGDVRCDDWFAVAAALDPSVKRRSVVVLRASDGLFGACLAVFFGREAVETVALLDERYFRPGGIDLAPLVAFADAFPRASSLVARRDGTGGQSTKALRGLLGEDCAVAGVEVPGVGALRAVRLFASVERLVIASAPAPTVDQVRVHAKARALYAPFAGAAFAAKRVRDDRAAWRSHLAAACAARGGARLAGALDVAFSSAGARFSSEEEQGEEAPFVLFLPDQLDVLRRAVTRRVAGTPVRLDDGAAATLVPSSADRYVEGGYSERHYVKAAPDPREPAFELRLDASGAQVGFVSIGFSAFGSAAADGARWPFSAPDANFDCATVSRLVVLEAARGLGAPRALLSACAAFHAMGVACRITTRKKDVAAKVLGKLAVLRADEAQARKAARATAADENARALVPFDPDAAERAFQATTPLAPRKRGRNLTWSYWYAGAPLVHPATGEAFAFVGGAARFAPVIVPPPPPP